MFHLLVAGGAGRDLSSTLAGPPDGASLPLCLNLKAELKAHCLLCSDWNCLPLPAKHL
jgi:hypothetical protein